MLRILKHLYACIVRAHFAQKRRIDQHHLRRSSSVRFSLKFVFMWRNSSALMKPFALRDAILRNDLCNFHNFFQYLGTATWRVSNSFTHNMSMSFLHGSDFTLLGMLHREIPFAHLDLQLMCTTYLRLFSWNQAHRSLQLRLHIVNGITRLDIERNDLHSTTQTKFRCFHCRSTRLHQFR